MAQQPIPICQTLSMDYQPWWSVNKVYNQTGVCIHLQAVTQMNVI